MFCRFCGKQVLDEAYMCPSCGCMIRPLPQTAAPVVSYEPVAQPVSNEPSKAQKTFQKLSGNFTKVGIILNAVGLGLLVIAFIGLIMAMCASEELEAMSQVNYQDWNQIENLEGMLATGLIFWYLHGLLAILVTAFSVDLSTAGFVFSLIQKIDPNMKKRSIPVFVISIVFMVLSIYMFVFGFNAIIFTMPV